MPLWKRINALLVVLVLGVVACSDPPVAPAPAGKALGQAEADSTQSDAATDSPAPAIGSFADANLERAVRRTLNKPEGPLTADDLASLTKLDVEWQDVSGVERLAGLEHATALSYLELSGNAALADLSPLASLTSLETLDLGSTSIGDAGLASLSSLTNLKALHLPFTSVGDAGLASLSSLTNLETLHLSNTSVGDAGVAELTSLTKLKTLGLASTSITNAGLASLSSLTKLETLYLTGTSVGDAGVAELSSLTNLRYLHLSNTSVGDAGVISLSSLTSLKWLYLSNTSITDVSPLLSLTNLIELFLNGVTTLSAESINTHIPALEAAGVTVFR